MYALARHRSLLMLTTIAVSVLSLLVLGECQPDNGGGSF